MGGNTAKLKTPFGSRRTRSGPRGAKVEKEPVNHMRLIDTLE